MGSDKNKCVKCKNAIKDTEVVLMCGLWCKKTFHNECLGLSKREARAIVCSKVIIKFHCEACEKRLAIELVGGKDTQEAKNLGKTSVNLFELMQKLVKITEEMSSDNWTINSKLDTVISSNARLEEYLLQSPKRNEKQAEETSTNAVGYAGSCSTEIGDRNNGTNSHDQITISERMCRESEFQQTQDDFPEQVTDGQQQNIAERYSSNCLPEWDIPEGHDSTCDPLSIDEEKYSSSDGFLQPYTLSTEKKENVEDEVVYENNLEELKHEMGSTITGGEAESSTPVSVAADQISEDNGDLATSVFLPARSGHGKQHTNMLEVRCANKITHSTAVPVEAEKIKDSSGWISPVFLTARTGRGKQQTNKPEVPCVNQTDERNLRHRNDRCKKNFEQMQDLKDHSHMDRCDPVKSCNLCHKTFSTTTSLKRHIRSHTGEHPYSCSICNKAFPDKNKLAVHMRVHTGERPFVCRICNKAFSQKYQLINHMRVHTGERPYSCSICSKTFSIKCKLAIHMRVHTGERPYSCSICNKSFKFISNFKVHLRLHTEAAL